MIRPNILLTAFAVGWSALAVSPIAAAPSVPTPILQANEVPLHVLGKGKATSPADRATLTMNLKRSGATASEARAKVQLLADQLVAELVKRGVPQTAINVSEGQSGLGFVGNEAVAEAMMMADAGAAPGATKQKPDKQATLSIEVVLDNLALLPVVRKFLDDRDAVFLEGPALDLKDDRQARRIAINDAIRNAREEAEAYAAAANMRVVRMLDIDDQVGGSSMEREYSQVIRKMMSRAMSSSDGQVETTVSVTVGFALAPK